MRLLGQSFFLQKDFVRTKSIKSNKCTKNQPSKSTKSTKTPRQKHKDANKRISDFFLKKKESFHKKKGLELHSLFFLLTKRFCTHQKHQKRKDTTKQKHKMIQVNSKGMVVLPHQ